MKTFIPVYAILLLLAVSTAAESRSIRISTQQDFEQMLLKVRDGKEVDVTLADGVYYMDRPVTATAPLAIKGKGAVIKGLLDSYSKQDAVRTEKGYYVCPLKSSIPPFSLFLDGQDGLIPVSESVDEKTLVNLCSEVKGEFVKKIGAKVRIPVPSTVKSSPAVSDFSAAYGYFDCGWRVGNFSIQGVEGGDFLCTLMTRIDTPTFNYEKTFYNRDIRYVIYNAEPKAGCVHYTGSEIWIPEKYEAVKVMKATGEPVLTAKSDMKLTGLEFRDFGKILISSGGADAVSISNCSFLNSTSTSIEVVKTAAENTVPCVIEACTFLHCGLVEGYTILLKGPVVGTPVVLVRNCRMRRYDDAPLMYKNGSGMILSHGDFEVSGCTMTNTPRTAITCYLGNSIVRNNVVFNTEAFNSFRERNLANDFGMIYVNYHTKKSAEAVSNKLHRVLIEDNLVYGALANNYDSRGIMLDDGRGDVICRRNVIHVPNSYYSMGSRECPNFIGTSSIRNVFENNVVTTVYRLQGGAELKEADYPIVDGNILLGSMENQNYRVKVVKDDYVFKDAVVYGIEDGKLVLDSKTRKAVKKLIRSKYIK